MGSTRTERAIDELDVDSDDFEPSCDDIRLAWLASELSHSAVADFDAMWADR